MHYNTIYLAIFTAVAQAVSARTILPRGICDSLGPSTPCPVVNNCIDVGAHCDNPSDCCDFEASMFISVLSIHYHYIDLPLSVCNLSNICEIIMPWQLSQRRRLLVESDKVCSICFTNLYPSPTGVKLMSFIAIVLVMSEIWQCQLHTIY